MSAFIIFVGGYTGMITALSFNPGSTSLSTLSTTYAGTNPTWLAVHPTNKSVLFATQETYTGAVLSFAIGSSGRLTQLGSVSTGGASPVHLTTFNNGTEIAAINYEGGNGRNIALTADKGHFGTAYPGITFNGSGPQPRQTHARPHQVIEYGSELLVPDLGADKIWRLSKSSSGGLQNNGYIQQPAGSGPRHVITDGTTLYTLHELSNTLTQQVIPPLGSSTQPAITASLNIIPSDSTNPSAHTAAELLLSPASSAFPTRYLYATNRGDASDAITIISIAGNTLQILSQVRTGLKTVRGAAFSPGDGKYLVVGGQDSGGVVVYERTNGGASLKEVARTSGLQNPTGFVWL
ncbi:putative isomerase YbhE [Ceratobasidium sp. AG-I]|nr:putative isomerase YbhE [Ceratobasidium sp. AG-I]